MIEFKFTNRSVNALKCPDRRKLYSDTQIKELKLRNTPSGSKIFYFRKKYLKKVMDIRIGEYPAVTIINARLKAVEYASSLAIGVDPRIPKQVQVTVDELWGMYLEQHLKIKATPKSIADAFGNYKHYIEPEFSKVHIKQLDTSLIRKFFTQLFNRKGYAPHNKVLNTFKAMLNKAIEWELLDRMPITIKKATDVKRERYLQPDELPLFFKALGEEKRLTVDDITDYQGNIKDEFLIRRQQKTGQGNLVMLSDYTQKILSKWIGQTNKVKTEFLFTSIRKDTGEPITSTQYRRLVKKWASLARIDPETVSTHSLRRTKASIIFAKTGNIECIRQLLGQKSVTSTSHYLDLSKKESIAIAREIEL